jgi:hypothetical protein
VTAAEGLYLLRTSDARSSRVGYCWSVSDLPGVGKEDLHMPEAAIREPEQIRQACALKLRQVETNRSFKAILACLLGEEWTKPRIVELRLSPERNLFARLDGALTFKQYTANENDLIRTVHQIAEMAYLDGDELGYLLSELVKIKNKRCRRSSEEWERRELGE